MNISAARRFMALSDNDKRRLVELHEAWQAAGRPALDVSEADRELLWWLTARRTAPADIPS